MENENKPKNSPLLDRYIQRRNLEANFGVSDDKKISEAIRALIQQGELVPKELN